MPRAAASTSSSSSLQRGPVRACQSPPLAYWTWESRLRSGRETLVTSPWWCIAGALVSSPLPVFLLSLYFSLISGGCGRTGTFIAICLLIDRLKTEGVVDVFQTVRGLRLQRPGMVRSVVSQLVLILDVVASWINNVLWGLCIPRPTLVAKIITKSWKICECKTRKKCCPFLCSNSCCWLFWCSCLQDQYEFCYKSVLEYLGSFDTYANFSL